MDETTGVPIPEEAAGHDKSTIPPDHPDPDMGEGDLPIEDHADADDVVATPIPLLGARRGTLRVSLDSHGRSEGPREKAKPA